MEERKFVKSKKGKILLALEGYTYCLNKTVADKCYWACTEKTSLKCSVTVRTVIEHSKHILKTEIGLVDHLHPPRPEENVAREVRTNLKRKAEQSMESPSQIIQACKQEIPHNAAPYIPNNDAMRMIINRARLRNTPSIPKELSEVNYSDIYNVINNKNFLIGHYIYENESVLVFSTENNMRLLNDSSYWLSDGTFMCCPNPYTQMYTIHGFVGNKESAFKCIPLVYGLLSNKTENCYYIFFEIIMRHAFNEYSLDLRPQYVLTDFEIAATKALKRVFPDSNQKYCYFHLRQSIWKHIQQSGFAKRYGKDISFAHKMRHIPALAYLKPEEIRDTFLLLQKKEVLPKEANSIVS